MGLNLHNSLLTLTQLILEVFTLDIEGPYLGSGKLQSSPPIPRCAVSRLLQNMNGHYSIISNVNNGSWFVWTLNSSGMSTEPWGTQMVSCVWLSMRFIFTNYLYTCQEIHRERWRTRWSQCSCVYCCSYCTISWPFNIIISPLWSLY